MFENIHIEIFKVVQFCEMFRFLFSFIFFVNFQTSLCHVQGNLRHFQGAPGEVSLVAM